MRVHFLVLNEVKCSAVGYLDKLPFDDGLVDVWNGVMIHFGDVKPEDFVYEAYSEFVTLTGNSEKNA